MRSSHRVTTLVILAIAFLLAACATPANPSSSPAPTPSPVVTPDPSVTPGPSGTPQPSIDPSPTPVPTPVPTPSPTPKPVAWSGFQSIATGDECWGLSATIDAQGRHHLAAVCGRDIRYLTSPDGSSWRATDLPMPSERVDQDPQLAIDGDTAYLAFSRLAPEDGGCGDDGLQDLGVYVRSRSLPNGRWSQPVRVGVVADSLQGFRAVDGVQHLTVRAQDGGVFYESITNGALTRIALPNAVSASLRVGDDGHARIAFTTGHTLRYARVDGSNLQVSTIAKVSDTYIQAPLLVLGAGDRPYVLFTEYRDTGGGCVSIDPGPQDGTYFAWGGTSDWTIERFSKSIGSHTFTVDGSGRAHAIVTGDGSLRYFTSRGTGWQSTKISTREGLGDPIIRVDPASGRLVLFGIDGEDGIGMLVKPLG
jgi:hypothetical protein